MTAASVVEVSFKFSKKNFQLLLLLMAAGSDTHYNKVIINNNQFFGPFHSIGNAALQNIFLIGFIILIQLAISFLNLSQ